MPTGWWSADRYRTTGGLRAQAPAVVPGEVAAGASVDSVLAGASVDSVLVGASVESVVAGASVVVGASATVVAGASATVVAGAAARVVTVVSSDGVPSDPEAEPIPKPTTKAAAAMAMVRPTPFLGFGVAPSGSTGGVGSGGSCVTVSRSLS